MHDIACEAPVLAMAESLPIGVVVIADGHVVVANHAARALLGFDPARTAPAALFADADDAARVLQPERASDDVLRMRRADGSTFRACIGARTVPLGSQRVRLLMVNDLTESDRVNARLTEQHEELQAMARRLLTVQEDERRSLSRELHDDVGQAITAIKLTALAVPDEADVERRGALVDEIVAIADQTIVKLRNLSMLLRPPQLDALGLDAALRWQADTLFRAAGAPALTLDLQPLPSRAPPDIELACFRIAQESLTNVLRHAHAQHVDVTLRVCDDALRLDVFDDGHGIDATRPQGLGLVTMRERAQLVGGTLDIESDARGTRVRACLPL